MIVVADTSPVNYFVLVENIWLLPLLYKRVLIPPAVFDELTHPSAPQPVREWTESHPSWLEIVSPKSTIALPEIDLGESQAIALGIELGADVLLIDDWAGRRAATRRGLRVAGTLSVLDDADQAGFVDFEEVVARLQRTSFRMSQGVLQEVRRKRSK